MQRTGPPLFFLCRRTYGNYTIYCPGAWFQPTSGSRCDARPPHSIEEKARIEAALEESRGRISGARGAATRLGLPRTPLRVKIRRLTINKYKYQVVGGIL